MTRRATFDVGALMERHIHMFTHKQFETYTEHENYAEDTILKRSLKMSVGGVERVPGSCMVSRKEGS
jgi:hypothetical protein